MLSSMQSISRRIHPASGCARTFCIRRTSSSAWSLFKLTCVMRLRAASSVRTTMVALERGVLGIALLLDDLDLIFSSKQPRTAHRTAYRPQCEAYQRLGDS